MVRMHRCFLILFLLYNAHLCLVPRIVCGQGTTQRGLPPEVERILPWLPEDTETLVVAQSFNVPSWNKRESEERNSKPRLQDGETYIQLLALEGLFELNDGKYLETLAGTKVVLALRGGRNFDVVSSFGSLRNEGCSVVVFEKTLYDVASDWCDSIRAESKEIRKIAGRDVFVFASATVMEGVFKQQPWQGA